MVGRVCSGVQWVFSVTDCDCDSDSDGIATVTVGSDVVSDGDCK